MRRISYNEKFLQKLDEKHSAFRERLANYLQIQDDEAIHGARTAFRRLEACYCVFPIALRNPASEIFMSRAKEFFRFNSRIRDCDVMAGKLAESYPQSCAKLIEDLRAERQQQLRTALGMARELAELKCPRLSATAGTSLRQALRDRAQERGRRISSCRPVVLTEEATVEEVHSMRKQAKKLFYLMELDEQLGSLRLAVSLKLFQRLAGEIHDCDITLQLLADTNQQKPPLDEVRVEQSLTRHGYHQELRGLLQDGIWDSLESIRISRTSSRARPGTS